jgi:hypothetical protein
MGGGGIAGFDLRENKYLGSVMNLKFTPRHIVISPDQKDLIITSNVSGYLTKLSFDNLYKSLIDANGKRVSIREKQEVFIGFGARTIEVDPVNNMAYAAINNDLKVVAISLKSLAIVAEIKIDPYPVGLAVSKDGNSVVVTSQGHAGKGGGNAVNIISVHKK